jgi:hypothetical protein
VGLRAPAVVRLVGALAHCEGPSVLCPRRTQDRSPGTGRSSRHSGYPVARVAPKGPLIPTGLGALPSTRPTWGLMAQWDGRG